MKNKKEKILFSVSHMSGLSTAIALSHTKYKDYYCVLLTANDDPKVKVYHNLEKHGVFDKVLRVPDFARNDDLNIYENIIVKSFDNFFIQNDMPIESFKKIICYLDLVDLLTVYCCLKKTQYSMLETAPSQIYKEEVYDICIRDTSHNVPLGHLQRKHRTILGENQYCNKRYIFPETKSDDSKDEHVNFFELIYQIPKNVKENVLKSYNVQNCKIDNLLLMISAGLASALAKLPIYDPFFIFRFIMDLFFEHDDKVAVKPHPNWDPYDFDKLFPNAEIINPKMPIELLGYKDNFRIKKGITPSKSTFNKINQFMDEKIYFEIEFVEYNYLLIKLYVLCSIIKQLEFDNNFNIFKISACVLDVFYNNVLDFNNLEYSQNVIDEMVDLDISNGCITIISDIESTDSDILLEKLMSSNINSIVCFLQDNNFENYSKELVSEILKFSVAIEINKEILNQDLYTDPKKEVIYIYSKNNEVLNLIDTYHLEKHFKHTAINIDAQPVSLNKMSLYFDNLKLASKQVELYNEIKRLEQGIVYTQKQNQTLNNELNKVAQKSDALEKFAIDCTKIVKMCKKDLDEMNNRLNQLEKQ